VTVASPESVSSPSSRSARKKSNRNKTRPSQADSVLFRTSEPNRPDIAQEVGTNVLPGASPDPSDGGADFATEDWDRERGKEREREREGMEDRPVLPELGIGNKGDLASIASAGMSLLPSITNARLGPSYDLGSTPLGQNREPEDESVGRALVELKDKGLGTRSGEQPPLRGHERSSAIGSPRQKLAAIQTHSRSMTAAATASPQQSKVNLPGIREFFDGAPNGSLGRYTNGSSQPALSDYARSSRPLHDRQDFRPAQSSPYDARSSTAYARPSPQDTAYHGSSTTSPATTSGIHNARGVYYSKRRSSRGSEHAPTYQTSPSTNGYSTNDRLSSSVGSTPSDQRIDIESPLQSGHTNPTTAPEAGRRTSYSGAYPCDDPGCPAPPFATQYLLKYVDWLVFSFLRADDL
jgi:hypothetical protein